MLNTLTVRQRQDIQTFLSSVHLPQDPYPTSFAETLNELRALPLPSHEWVDKCVMCVKCFTSAIGRGVFRVRNIGTILSLVQLNRIASVGALDEAVSAINTTSDDYVRQKVKTNFGAVYTLFSYWTRGLGISESALKFQRLDADYYTDRGYRSSFSKEDQRVWLYFVGKMFDAYERLTRKPADEEEPAERPVARSLAPEFEAAAKADAATAAKADAATAAKADAATAAKADAATAANTDAVPENFTAKWARELADSVVAKKEQEVAEKHIAALKVKIHEAAKEGKYHIPIFPAGGSTAMPGIVYDKIIKYFTEHGFLVMEQSLKW